MNEIYQKVTETIVNALDDMVAFHRHDKCDENIQVRIRKWKEKDSEFVPFLWVFGGIEWRLRLTPSLLKC